MKSGERKCELVTLWFGTIMDEILGPRKRVKPKRLSVLHWEIQRFGDVKYL